MALKRTYRCNCTSNKKAKTMATTTQVKNMINRSIETKFLANSWNYIGANTANHPLGVQLPVSNITFGGQQGQRIANKVHLTGMELKIASNLTGHIRVIIYSPKDPSERLEAPTATGSVISQFVNNDQFWVLHDHIYPSNESGGGSVAININKKLNHKVYFKGNTSSDYSRNPVFALILAQYGKDGIGCTMDGYVKVWFKDA